MTQKEGVEPILDDYRAEFEQGDYHGFFEALLLCCWNSIPLPGWVCTLVIQQAEDAFNKRATGRGRTGNWRSQLNRLQIDRYRANHVDMHLRSPQAIRPPVRLLDGRNGRLRHAVGQASERECGHAAGRP